MPGDFRHDRRRGTRRDRGKKRELLDNPRLLFAHRLIANGIGGRTVFDFNRRLSESIELQDEFFRWMAYDTMFPLGYVDLHFARLMELIAAANTPKGKSRSSYKDFLLGELPTTPKTAEELEELLDVRFRNATRD